MKTPDIQEWDPAQYATNARFVSDLGAPLLELLKPQAGERILDLGCGDGALTQQIAATGADVLGIDSSAAMILACRELGLNAQVGDGTALEFHEDFDAVFTNAALHWMRQPQAVVAGVWRALRPGGRFVGEFGGSRNVHTIVAALDAALAKRNHAVECPWFFPTATDYAELLHAQGFIIEDIALFPRPTPLPGQLSSWLETFARFYTQVLPVAEHPAFIAEVAATCGASLRDAEGQWHVDYVRLRFSAMKKAS